MRTSAMQRDEGPSWIDEEHLPEQEEGLSGADEFQKALYMERKRRERSRKALRLLLIDVERIPEEELDWAARMIFRRLAELTRETDLKGWYSQGRAIGVLFNEFNSFDNEQVIRKIRKGLELALPERQMEQLNLTIHDHAIPIKDGWGMTADPVLYPEVGRRYRLQGAFLLKRTVDIVGSIAALLLFSPFFLIIPVLIRFSSPGPVMFRQERVGLYGKLFTFLKFRTMYTGNDPRVHEDYVRALIAGRAGNCEGDADLCDNKGNGSNGNGADGKKPLYKIQNDKRITPIGQILRKTSLDELPQFINVLRGEMSLVGPRPPIPYEVRNYDIWHRTRIVEVKPGITGLWQVTGRSSTTFDEMVRLDIKYAREWSIWLDLKILARTPWAVLRGKGAY
jgi:lipopolysaccharide/colanic/teichoic acid biosynthesis glycosyltransferase